LPDHAGRSTGCSRAARRQWIRPGTILAAVGCWWGANLPFPAAGWLDVCSCRFRAGLAGSVVSSHNRFSDASGPKRRKTGPLIDRGLKQPLRNARSLDYSSESAARRVQLSSVVVMKPVVRLTFAVDLWFRLGDQKGAVSSEVVLYNAADAVPYRNIRRNKSTCDSCDLSLTFFFSGAGANC
jgi:hypothetical protein